MKQAALKSKSARVALNLLRNWQNRRGLEAGSRLPHGETCSPDEAVAYARAVLDDYLHYGELDSENLAGLEILELGPGANQLVGRGFLMRGARRVTSVDRFDCLAPDQIRIEQERAWEKLLTQDEQGQWQAAASGLHFVPGITLETLPEALPGEQYDIIVSRAVLEYVGDITALFTSLNHLLKPGGRMLHKIDFRDDGMFSAAGHHPLTRFTFSKALYSRMTSHSYRPTANLLGDFFRVAAEHGLKLNVLVTHLIGQPEEQKPHLGIEAYPADKWALARDCLAAIRPRIHPDYAHLSDEDLIISGVFIIAERAN